MTIKNGMRPVHPGEVLREELETLGLSASALAKAIDVPANRVTAILNAERGITADTALRLSRYFDTTAQFWLNLQQTWQLRLAENNVGSRILERVVSRQAQALRTAACQATAVNDQSASALKAIERNLALCDQLSAVERTIGLYASNEHAFRALASPFDELRRIGALYTTLGHELHHTTQWLVEYQKRFRVANVDHVSRLVAQLGATQSSSVVERLAAMKNPWLDVHDELGAVKRVLDLQRIGRTIESQATFSESAGTQFRNWLGDWRAVTWPDNIWRDLAARTEFYSDLGFDVDLTDLPAPAFHEATAIAGSEPLPLVESHEPVATLRANSDEAAFARTNEAHDRLQRFESHLRRFIDDQMTQACGSAWPKHRLPNNMYERWIVKENAAVQARRPERALVAYADFNDYIDIITRKDNWKQVFEMYFFRREDVRESFQRLRPIRLDTMHARPISQDDELLLYVEVKRIMRAIGA